MSRIGQLMIRASAFNGVMHAPLKSTLVACVVGCALFMGMLDASIIAAAVPSISAALHVDPLDMSAAITSYLLAMIVTVPATAWLAGRVGARTLFVAGIVVFTLSSLACGFAPSLTLLVVARLVQGVGAALMAAVGRMLVLQTTKKAEYVSALSYLAIPALVAPMIGPPLGGFLIVHGSWRQIFLINIPIGAMSLAATLLLVKGGDDKQEHPFDLKGFLLASAALACLVFGLEASSSARSSSVLTVGLLTAGILAGGAYIAYARKRAHPILDLRLFKTPSFAIALIGGNLGRLSLGAMPYLLMLLLQIGFGLDALQAGSIAFATAIGSLSVKFTVAPVVRWFGFRRALLFNGTLCGGLTMGCALLQGSMPHSLIAFVLLSLGFFRSLHLTLANTLGYADVAETDIADATSVATTAQYLALAAGVALASLVMRVSAVLRDAPGVGERDIDWAIVVVGALYACSSIVFRRLHADAGASLTPERRNG